MTTTTFANPEAIQDAVIVCLAGAFSEDDWSKLYVHKGSIGTGHLIDCCPDGLLRVEAGILIPEDPRGRRWLGRPSGCVDLSQQIVVTYRRCYKSVRVTSGKNLKPEEYTAQGLAMQASGWQAILALACCTDAILRFASMQFDDPAACTGWTLNVDATIRMCAGPCPTIE